jgi:hypothetical protein
MDSSHGVYYDSMNDICLVSEDIIMDSSHGVYYDSMNDICVGEGTQDIHEALIYLVQFPE